jgi:PAS domain S-box-containing protein
MAFETFHRAKNGRLIPIEIHVNYLAYDGQEFHCAFVRDITERKRAEEALRQSEAQLKEAQRIAHIGSWELDLVGKVLVWSDETYRIFEIHPAKFGASYEAFLALVHPDDRDLVNRAYTDSVANRTSYNIVHRLLMSDGRIKFVRERCETQYASDGRSLRSTGTVQDITEQKQAEEALSRREQELRTVLDALPVGVWFTDASGKVLLANPAGRRIWKSVAKVGTNQSFKCEGWWEEAGPSAEPHRWALAAALSKGESSLNETLEIECRDGSRKTIRNSAVPVRGDDGRVQGAIVLNEDITDRVRAEQGLRQNHALLSAIMDASIDLVYVKDLDGRYVHMNRAGARVLGMPIEEVIGWDDVAIWGGELAASCRATDRQVIESGETVTVEDQDTTHGRTVHYLTTKAPYRDPEGRIIGVIGVSRDITERKQAEIERANQYDELQAILGMTVALSRATTLEEIYQKALDGVDRALKTDRASILLFDKQGIMRFVAARGLSEEYRKAVDGHSPWSREAQDPQPLVIRDTTTDPTIESYRSVFLSEGIRAMAFIPLMSPDGLLGRFMLYYGEPHKFTENEISVAQTIAGHVAFVIQRAKAEDALRLSEERFAKAFRSSLHPVVIAELGSGLIIEANDAAHQLFGYTREDVAGRTTLQIGLWPSPEDRARFVALLKKQGSVRNLEVSLRMKNGAFRQCLLSSEMIELDGKLCMVTVGNDITDRKRAEEELRQSHAFLRQVIDIDPNFIFAKDRDGRFTLVNKAVADAYGTTVDDLIGKTDADFNPNREEVEHFRAKDLEVIDSLQERFISEEVITDASGRTRWLQTVKRPILDEHGLGSMVLGAATDITERKRMEEELRQRERDLRAALEEREQISQDLHDGILQSLYAMGLSLETCRPLLKKMRARNITMTLDRVVKQLNEVMGEVRAFIAGLETELWRKQDLASAIRTMVQTLAQPHETRYRILIDPSVNQSITPEQGMHLFSIVKEAMSNCLRHAKAKHATVSLRNVKDGIRLTVSDNGIGFMPARVTGTGHGLANMASRASRVGGTFAIHSKPKQGTRIILDIPKETIHV